MVLPDVILRLDENDKIVAVEILSVSENIAHPESLEYSDITRPGFDEQLEKNSK